MCFYFENYKNKKYLFLLWHCKYIGLTIGPFRRLFGIFIALVETTTVIWWGQKGKPLSVVWTVPILNALWVSRRGDDKTALKTLGVNFYDAYLISYEIVAYI